MADRHTMEVLNEIRSAVYQFESFVNELRIDYREGAREPVGSPAYVRRLRDQAAVAVLGGMAGNLDRQQAVAALDRGTNIGEALGVTAKTFADDAVRALGYEPPGEPGKEG